MEVEVEVQRKACFALTNKRYFARQKGPRNEHRTFPVLKRATRFGGFQPALPSFRFPPSFLSLLQSVEVFPQDYEWKKRRMPVARPALCQGSEPCRAVSAPSEPNHDERSRSSRDAKMTSPRRPEL